MELGETQLARQRALADFRNYQKRAMENEVRARRDGVRRVTEGLLTALDQFDLALAVDPESMTVENMLLGVSMVRDELAKALEQHGVARIEPTLGDALDANSHEAVSRETCPDAKPGTIVRLLQVGYRIGDVVVRAAQVAVASEPSDGDEADGSTDAVD